MTTIYETLTAALAAEQPIAVATVVGGAEETGAKLLIRPDGSTLGALGAGLPEQQIVADALAMLARDERGIRAYATATGDVEVFVETFPPPPTMYIVGAVHIAIPLVTFAQTLGFRVVVVDARGAFATPERFAHADELIMAWPDEALEGKLNSNSFVVLLTHDPKLDDPALKIALPSPARYIGALGSPKTHARRLERLRAEGVPEEQLARLHAPIGLKIGANTPEEIAASIIAEIVAARHGLTGKA
jgi:xanthine dehydrogenase accessory factor